MILFSSHHGENLTAKRLTPEFRIYLECQIRFRCYPGLLFWGRVMTHT